MNTNKSKKTFKNKNRILTNTFFVAAVAVICTLLWGTAFPAIKIGYELFEIPGGDIPSKLIFAGARFFIAGILVLLIGLCTKNRRKMLPGRRDILPVSLLGLFQTFFQYLLLYIGLVNVTGVRSSLLTSVSAFGSVILSAVFFKSDRLTPKKMIGCVIGVTGLVVMCVGSEGLSGFTVMGDGLVILSNLSGAAGNIISKKSASGRHPFMLSGWQLITGGGGLLLLGAALGGRLSFHSAGCVLILIYLSLVAGVGFMLWTMLLFYNDVSRVAVFNLLIPVFGTMWSGIFLNEKIFTLQNILSLILVCSGIFIVNSKFAISSDHTNKTLKSQ